MTDKIQVLDKTFELYIDSGRIQSAIRKMADQIQKDLRGKNPLFLCVLNGSFMFAADLLKEFTDPCQISFVKLSSYLGTQTTEEVRTVLGLGEDIRNRDLVVLEDIIDSGITINHLVNDLRQYGPRTIRVATLLLKPDALRGNFVPDYVGIQIPNDFVVGYGLDYNGFGRNTKDIYKIQE